MSEKEDLEEALEVVTFYQPLEIVGVAPYNLGWSAYAKTLPPLVMRTPSTQGSETTAFLLYYQPDSPATHRWQLQWGPSIYNFGTLGIAMSEWFSFAGIDPWSLFENYPPGQAPDDPELKHVWDVLVNKWGFTPPKTMQHPWGGIIPMPVQPAPVKAPKARGARSGDIKVRISPMNYGGATLRPVNDEWTEAFKQQVIDNGGGANNTAYVQNLEDLRGVIPDSKIKELDEGYDATVLMDPWGVGGFYGYDAHKVAEMGGPKEFWKRRDPAKPVAPNPPPTSHPKDGQKDAEATAKFLYRFLSFWQPMEKPGIGFVAVGAGNAIEFWNIHAEAAGPLMGNFKSTNVLHLDVYNEPRLYEVHINHANGSMSTFKSPRLAEAIWAWFREYQIDPRGIYDIQAQTPEDQKELDWAKKKLKELQFDPDRATDPDEDLDDLANMDAGEALTNLSSDYIEPRLDQIIKAQEGDPENLPRDHYGFPLPVNVNIPGVEWIVEQLNAHHLTRDGSCVDSSMIETLGELLFLEDLQNFDQKPYWTDYDFDKPKKSNLHEMWQQRDDAWEKFEGYNLDWEHEPRPEEPEEPDQDDFESDEDYDAAFAEYEKAKEEYPKLEEKWQDERNDALNEEWEQYSGCVFSNLFDGYKRAAARHGAVDRPERKAAKNPSRLDQYLAIGHDGESVLWLWRGGELKTFEESDLTGKYRDHEEVWPNAGRYWRGRYDPKLNAVSVTSPNLVHESPPESLIDALHARFVTLDLRQFNPGPVPAAWPYAASNPPESAGRFDYIQGRYKMSEQAASPVAPPVNYAPNPRKKKAAAETTYADEARDAGTLLQRLVSFWQPLENSYKATGLNDPDRIVITLWPQTMLAVYGRDMDTPVLTFVVQDNPRTYEIMGYDENGSPWEFKVKSLEEAARVWLDQNDIDTRELFKLQASTPEEQAELKWAQDVLTERLGLDPDNVVQELNEEGWTIKSLHTKQQMLDETEALNNTLVDLPSEVKRTGDRIFSLRDPKDQPQATIRLARDSDLFKEAQGRDGKSPNRDNKERIGEWLQSIGAYREDESESISHRMWERVEPEDIMHAVWDYYDYERGNQDSGYDDGEYGIPYITPIEYEDADEVLMTASDIWEQRLRDTGPHARGLSKELDLKRIEEIASGIVAHMKHGEKGVPEDPKRLTKRAWAGLLESDVAYQYVAEKGVNLTDPAALKAYLEWVFENAEKGAQVQALCALVLLELGQIDTAYSPPLTDAPGQSELAFNRQRGG